MKLNLLLPVISALLRQIGQKDLADQVSDALHEMTQRIILQQRELDGLVKRMDAMEKSLSWMVKARKLAGESSADDIEQRLKEVEARLTDVEGEIETMEEA